MAKERLITITQLKKSLLDFERDELTAIITDIAQACPQAREFLTIKLAPHENAAELLEKYKQKVEYEFFPKRGMGRLNLREAKKAVSDFRKICPDKSMGIDLMLFYTENCVAFTDEYGDISEAFYNSAVGMYDKAVREINAGGADVYAAFADRLKAAAENACEGWGFRDDMMEIYEEIVWLNKDN